MNKLIALAIVAVLISMFLVPMATAFDSSVSPVFVPSEEDLEQERKAKGIPPAARAPACELQSLSKLRFVIVPCCGRFMVRE